MYSHVWSAYSAAEKYGDRSWEHINCSQAHEFGNKIYAVLISRKGIHFGTFLILLKLPPPLGVKSKKVILPKDDPKISASWKLFLQGICGNCVPVRGPLIF
jgi:hypothetical protein